MNNLINLKHNKSFITMDLKIKQIRFFTRGEKIYFIKLNNNDIDGYSYLFKNDFYLFCECLKEDFKNNLNIDLNLNNIKIL